SRAAWRRAVPSSGPCGPIVAARSLAAGSRQGVQERPADALRLAGAAGIFGDADAPVPRLADDLLGPAVLALVCGLASFGCAVHHRHLGLAASGHGDRHLQAPRAEGEGMATHSAGGD